MTTPAATPVATEGVTYRTTRGLYQVYWTGRYSLKAARLIGQPPKPAYTVLLALSDWQTWAPQHVVVDTPSQTQDELKPLSEGKGIL